MLSVQVALQIKSMQQLDDRNVSGASDTQERLPEWTHFSCYSGFPAP